MMTKERKILGTCLVRETSRQTLYETMNSKPSNDIEKKFFFQGMFDTEKVGDIAQRMSQSTLFFFFVVVVFCALPFSRCTYAALVQKGRKGHHLRHKDETNVEGAARHQCPQKECQQLSRPAKKQRTDPTNHGNVAIAGFSPDKAAMHFGQSKPSKLGSLADLGPLPAGGNSRIQPTHQSARNVFSQTWNRNSILISSYSF